MRSYIYHVMVKTIVPCFILTIFIMPGCLSVQYLTKERKPALFGLGSAGPLNGTNGQIFRIIAPGLSLHLTPLDFGLSLGWHETLYFYPHQGHNEASVTQPVAYQIKNYGIDCGNNSLSLGYNRAFYIIFPRSDESIVQYISFDENNPLNTKVRRKEKL